MLRLRQGLLAVLAVAFAVLGLSACGSDSPTGNTGDTLSGVEAQFLVLELFDLLEVIDIPLLDTGPDAAGPARVPYGELYDAVIDGSQGCTGGGLATLAGSISGDVDEGAGTADLAVSATMDFDGCVVVGETLSFTLEGDPNIQFDGDIDITAAAISIVIGFDGVVAFTSSDGRAGTCSLDISVTATATDTNVSETVTGAACGANASSFDIALFD